jgi:hypothetical protein
MADASEWISVGALGAAFERDSHTLPESSGLAGRRFQLHFENGWRVEYRFSTGSHLQRTVRDTGRGGEPPTEASVTYSATEIRPNLYYVSFIE